MNVRVFRTRRLFPESEALLRRSVRLTRRRSIAEGAVVQLTDRIDARFLEAMPRLRVISQCAVGVDNIDLSETLRRGITVMNTPGVLTEATADLTWGLILSLTRRIPEANRFCRDGRYEGWDLELLLGGDLQGRMLGIIGPGRIGCAVARRAAGFGMRIVYDGLRRLRQAPVPGMRRFSRERLLAESDIVTLHVPGSEETRHLIGLRQLRLMKQTAYLVNTSRGSVVDERALIDALAKGSIAGAALDVFENEPRIPARLRRMRNVVLTPHIASATRDTRGAMAMTAARNVIDFFRGRADPRNVVR